MARRALALLLLLAVGLAPPAQGRDVQLTGDIHLEGPFVVGQGDVLTIVPGTRITGVGPIEVNGSLIVKGALIEVPVLLLRNESHVLEDSRLARTNGTAIEVLAGRVEMRNVTFEAHRQRALVVRGDAVVVGERLDLRDNPGDALYVQEAADVQVANSSFTGNGRGASVFSAARVRIDDARFADNGQHLVVELGPWTRPGGTFQFHHNDLGPVARGPTALASVLLRHASPVVDEPVRIEMGTNRIHDGRVGLRAEGPGILLESTDDVVVDNGVGLSIQVAKVRMRGATLGNAQNVEGGGDLVLEGVSYVPIAATAAAPARATVPPWVVVAAALLALAGVGALVALRGRAAPAPPEPEPMPEPERARTRGVPVEEPPVLSGIERRILEDILAHPGSAQRAVADRLGYTRQALHYHVKKLEARGLVEKTVEGRETRCTVPPRVARLLGARPRVEVAGSDGSD